ncbi:hypothetical protein FE257_010311 [Aspergillus nanangensis]|uniref:Phenylalanine ammonia-lyase n=1 Tax=Aspergillus nanangensis TaxID=2582783 RepID=A0AAD4CIS2_ASPNN|nr:hypothetical protein FE257_010311 [Aspergillus nanangensis]
MASHLSRLQETWTLLDSLTQPLSHVALDGESLSVAAVVAVSRHSIKASLPESGQVLQRLQESVDALTAQLERGEQVYGVNTGCGGNANTRTRKLEILQHSFFQHHQAGIILKDACLPDMNEGSQTLAPEATRGTILLRCNSLLRGHSAVRIEVIDILLRILNAGYVPLIPLRGSISASGDLSPLSYLGGLLEGNEDIFVHSNQDGQPKILSAGDALRNLGLEPLQMSAKEGLGVMNGTAVSTAVGTLALHDSNNLALLTQVLTAMATEALLGTVDNYHQFISRCRPHPGQMEAAKNIRHFLHDSHLCQETDVNKSGLVQDRYALRTAPQWIGPQLEDLLSAGRQIDVELNSTTDNPLIDVQEGRFHHGGNFQAASVTSAMEKCRSALVMLGRLLLGQCGEITNPSLSKGLTANLAFDDPSLSFAAKGLDVNMTAYFSELAYLGHSVGSHVQSAEMNNQSVNSLALISARYTGQSVQLLSMMCAVHLYILCQALDLRALTIDFFLETKPDAREAYHRIFANHQVASPLSPSSIIDFDLVWTQAISTWYETSHMDLVDRCNQVSASSFAYVVDTQMRRTPSPSPEFYHSAKQWKDKLLDVLFMRYNHTRKAFVQRPSTCSYLGVATKEMYLFVRKDLGVPLHQGIQDHPPLAESMGGAVQSPALR